MDITRDRWKKIVEAGANVILCARAIDDFAEKYFVENKWIAVRRVKKHLLRQIAHWWGATVVISLSDFENQEKFEKSWLG